LKNSEYGAKGRLKVLNMLQSMVMAEVLKPESLHIWTKPDASEFIKTHPGRRLNLPGCSDRAYFWVLKTLQTVAVAAVLGSGSKDSPNLDEHEAVAILEKGE
jgi:hypothetical protein